MVDSGLHNLPSAIRSLAVQRAGVCQISCAPESPPPVLMSLSNSAAPVGKGEEEQGASAGADATGAPSTQVAEHKQELTQNHKRRLSPAPDSEEEDPGDDKDDSARNREMQTIMALGRDVHAPADTIQNPATEETIEKERNADVQEALTAPESARRPAPAFTHTSFVRATSADAWFLSTTHRRNFATRKLGRDILRGTSTKRISQIVSALDASELPRLARIADDQAPNTQDTALPVRTRHSQRAMALQLDPERQDMYVTQLLHGFHIMLYGVGDKAPVARAIVERMARNYGSASLLVQGAAGRALSIDRIIKSIEQALGTSLPETSGRTAMREDRVSQRIRQLTHCLNTRASSVPPKPPHRLVLGLLAFDDPIFHTTRIHTLIHALARCERVHIVATVSQVNAGLLLDGSAGSFGLGIAGHAEVPLFHLPGIRTLRAPWLWHHATTYVPPISELVQSRGTAASSSSSTGLASLKLPAAVDLAGGRARAAPGASVAAAMAQPISDAAAIQVLQTITSRARSLFSQLAALQLVAVAEAGADVDDGSVPRTPYVVLMREALREFIASSDESVRQLLGEMVDHGLVIVTRGATTVTNSHAIAVGDELSIPFPVPVLEQVLAQIA